MLTVTVDSKLVTDVLNKLQKRMADLTPVMDGIGQALESKISARFETRSDPQGHHWEPWEKSTGKKYPKDGKGLLLERYGAMLQSRSFTSDKTSVRVGFSAVASKNKDVYAAYHEFGTKTMKRRGLLFADPNAGTLGADDEKAVLEVIDDYLNNGL